MASLFQFSIRGLLVAVSTAALGIAALLNANGWWVGAIWGLALCVLAASLPLIVYRRGQARAFWVGFAIFGWLYLALFLTSLLPSQTQYWFRNDPLRHDFLITTQLAQAAYELILPESRRTEQVPAPSQPTGGAGSGMPVGPATGTMPATGGTSAPPGPGGMGPDMGGGGGFFGGSFSGPGGPPGGGFPIMIANPSYVPRDLFTHIAHALWLLLIAACGGKACQVIYRTRPQEA